MPIFGFTPQEKQVPVLPSGVASLLVVFSLMLSGILDPGQVPVLDLFLVIYCLLNSFYLAHFHFVLIPSPHLRRFQVWTFVLLEVVGAAILAFILPERSEAFLSALMVLLSITISIIAERKPSYAIAAGFAVPLFLITVFGRGGPNSLLRAIGSALIAGVAIEAVHQLKHLTRRNINRLEIINEFSRQITSSLETRQVLSLLTATVQNALEADSYFIGLLEDSTIHLALLYDDGEYFSDVKFRPQGTLSGWVIDNQKELFLPDLRRDLSLAGVEIVVAGKEKTSLSWMGVPMTGLYLKGVIGIASYQPNAFDRSDLELMNNMARHAALALDNTFRHAEVEQQSHLDSLTGVYNHGYFLKLLKQKLDEAVLSHSPLALIMVDLDYFKQFNDRYGHLLGDEILTAVCSSIRRHIKQTDFVGRWGGEEFAIALPGANGSQAGQVAQRIHETMSLLEIQNQAGDKIPSPTLSQGIAQFPDEANETIKLVDLADQRLYIAKERGRNQIEPAASHWDAR
jgi:diguanylate cyclase (GGDEF)-like protein